MALTKITNSGITDSAVNTDKIADNTIVDADINASAGISPSKFGLSTPPTLTSFTPSELTVTSGGSITITGTGFVSIPQVTLINQSTGAIITASSVTYTSSTTISASIPSGQTNGTYKVRVENPDGNAVQSTSTLTYSDNPTWVTASGSLGTLAAGSSVSLSVSAYSDDSSSVTYSETTSVLTSNTDTPDTTMNLTLNSSTGAITGTAPEPDSETTYNFTLRATDAESQTTDRAFSITISVGITEGMQFN